MPRRTAPPAAAPLFPESETRGGTYSTPVAPRAAEPQPMTISAEAAGLLARIAAHYGRSPQDQLLAMLSVRWQAIEAEVA